MATAPHGQLFPPRETKTGEKGMAAGQSGAESSFLRCFLVTGFALRRCHLVSFMVNPAGTASVPRVWGDWGGVFWLGRGLFAAVFFAGQRAPFTFG
jgi:hypothetical protein